MRWGQGRRWGHAKDVKKDKDIDEDMLCFSRDGAAQKRERKCTGWWVAVHPMEALPKVLQIQLRFYQSPRNKFASFQHLYLSLRCPKNRFCNWTHFQTKKWRDVSLIRLFAWLARWYDISSLCMENKWDKCQKLSDQLWEWLNWTFCIRNTNQASKPPVCYLITNYLSYSSLLHIHFNVSALIIRPLLVTPISKCSDHYDFVVVDIL